MTFVGIRVAFINFFNGHPGILAFFLSLNITSVGIDFECKTDVVQQGRERVLGENFW